MGVVPRGERSQQPVIGFAVAIVLICLAGSGPAAAQILGPGQALDRITARDIAESLISLNNFTAAPGVEGSNIKVDLNDGQPEIIYGRFSIQIPISIKTKIDWLNVYIEPGYGSLFVEDRYFALTLQSNLLGVKSERQVDSGRLGLGVEFHPTPSLFIAPYFVASGSKVNSTSRFTGGPLTGGPPTPIELVLLTDWSVAAYSVGGVLDVRYLKWFGEKEKNRFDLETRYAITWTDTFNESLSILNTQAWKNTLTVETLYRRVTDFRILSKRFGWNTFANVTSFPGQDKRELGFTYYFGIGAGVELYIPERLWGRIGRNFIGVRGSALIGNDTRGWSVVLALRN